MIFTCQCNADVSVNVIIVSAICLGYLFVFPQPRTNCCMVVTLWINFFANSLRNMTDKIILMKHL